MIDNFSWVIRDKLAGSAIPAEAYGGSSTILGSGRASGTGLVLCCTVGRYLRLPADRAIAAVRRIRSALDTREQESFVRHYLESR
jgi:hypothetical protein